MGSHANHGGVRKRRQKSHDYGPFGPVHKFALTMKDINLSISKELFLTLPKKHDNEKKVAKIVSPTMKTGDVVTYLASSNEWNCSQKMKDTKMRVVKEFCGEKKETTGKRNH